MQSSELENPNDKKVIAIGGGANHSYRFDIEEVAEAISQIAEAISGVFEAIKNSLYKFFESFKNHGEKIKEYNCEFHKLDFTRKKIVHQVMCRKPKHLVKKII